MPRPDTAPLHILAAALPDTNNYLSDMPDMGSGGLHDRVSPSLAGDQFLPAAGAHIYYAT